MTPDIVLAINFVLKWRFCPRKIFEWNKKFLVKKIWVQFFFLKIIESGMFWVKMCWVVVSFVRLGHTQNFRPREPLFLVEVKFVGVWWVGLWVDMNSISHVKPNRRLRF